MTISRVQPGVPAGDHFTASLHPEADVALTGAYGLTIHPSAASPLAYDLAQEGGLTGTVTGYGGDNPDVPAGALTYKHPQAYGELLISDTDGEFEVRYDDRYDEANSFTTSTDSADPEDRTNMIKGVLFDLDVANAAESTLGFGEAYERRTAEVARDGSSAQFVLSANEEDHDGQIAYLTVSHDYKTGATSVFDDNARKNLEGGELAAKLNEVSLDLSGGDHSQPSLKDRFNSLVVESAKSPFASDAVRVLAAGSGEEDATTTG
ncbi:hypothetical protein [Arthrobacter sp. HLT1-21]